MQSYSFGPVKVSDKPDFKLHDLCTAWNQASDLDLDEMISITRLIGGISNNPITLWNGLILDGRNRQITAQTLGIPLEYREFSGTYEQARAYVIAINLARRHLTPSQRAVMAARISEIDHRNGFGSVTRVKDVAITAQTNLRAAKRAIEVVKASNESGDTAMLDRIFRGESTPARELKNLGNKALDFIGPKIMPNRPVRDLAKEMFTDSDGVMVPDCLMDVWNQVVRFNKLRTYFELSLPDIQRLMDHPVGKHLSVEHVRHLKEMIRDLDARQPSLVCPHCEGERKCYCDLCRRRWSSRGMEDKQECYCCNGDGYLVKEQPYPDTEWVKKKSE